eukprot:363974-Chlamydomonas_euryale.AAC.15
MPNSALCRCHRHTSVCSPGRCPTLPCAHACGLTQGCPRPFGAGCTRARHDLPRGPPGGRGARLSGTRPESPPAPFAGRVGEVETAPEAQLV